MHGEFAYDCGPAGYGNWDRATEKPGRRERKRAMVAAMHAEGERGGPHGGRRGGPDYGGFGIYGRWGGPNFGRNRKRMRRGDVRAAILVLLDEQPRNGYQLMQEIEDRSEGAWRPSPGSVYPALSQLEDEGLVAATEADGRKAFALTDEGTKHVAGNREQLGEPWARIGEDVGTEVRGVADQIKPLMSAVAQIMQAGSAEDARRAGEILADTRRKLYAILAEDRTNQEDS